MAGLFDFDSFEDIAMNPLVAGLTMGTSLIPGALARAGRKQAQAQREAEQNARAESKRVATENRNRLVEQNYRKRLATKGGGMSTGSSVSEQGSILTSNPAGGQTSILGG